MKSLMTIAVASVSQKGVYSNYTDGTTSFNEYDAEIERLYQNQVLKQQASYKQFDKSMRLTLNEIQIPMYTRLMKKYTESEMSFMKPWIKKALAEDYRKAQFLLRKMKFDKQYNAETKIVNAMFPHMKIGTKLIDYLYKNDLPKEVTLRSLHISQQEVVDEFIKNRLLPKNFYELTFTSLQL